VPAIRNVIFDLGGVLLDWSPQRILEELYQDAESRLAMHEAVFRHPDWRAFDRGTISENELLANLATRTGRRLDDLSALLSAIRHSLVAKDDTVAVLRRLHARGVPLYCLSDMPAPIFEFVRGRYDFFDMFRGIVVSGQVKLMKPEREVFQHLLQRFELRADETVFVDDRMPNLEGARSVGLHTIHFCDAEVCELAILAGLHAAASQTGGL